MNVEHKITFPPAVLKEIRSLVQLNCHGEAYLSAAKALGNDLLANRFEKFNRRHIAKGGLDAGMMCLRDQMYRELMADAKVKLVDEDYRHLYAAT